jgi:type II secretory pathway pseudopilin PulG
LNSRLPCFTPRLRRGAVGFTLTELMVVLAIIIVLMGIGWAGWPALIGANSVDAAQNFAGAFVSRAREDSMNLRVPRGALFVQDGEATTMLFVHVANPGFRPGEMDLVPDADSETLQRGVGVRFLNNGTPRYSSLGLVLYDGQGQLYVRDFSISKASKLGQRLKLTDDFRGVSHVGMVMYQVSKYEAQPEAKRDEWLDRNARPLFGNRYTGTLVEGN